MGEFEKTMYFNARPEVIAATNSSTRDFTPKPPRGGLKNCITKI
jgi:hypothetical protein